jgi:hypothetical protein
MNRCARMRYSCGMALHTAEPRPQVPGAPLTHRSRATACPDPGDTMMKDSRHEFTAYHDRGPLMRTNRRR